MKALVLFLLSISLHASMVGKTAPGFTLVDEGLKAVSLKDFKGKYVVLEWLNHGCPFVKKHYNSRNMQQTQGMFLDKDSVWLSIISSAPGKQGFVSSMEALNDKNAKGSKANHILIDDKGTVGRAYGAKTTPHMFIIDPAGKVVYDGALDSINSFKEEDVPLAKNYIKLAKNDILAGKTIKISRTKPYGCGVKY